MAGIAGGTGHQLLPSEHSCPGVCPGAHRTGWARAGLGGQGWASAEQIPLGSGRASRPSGPGAPACWRWGALAFAWPTRGYTQTEGLTGPQLLLGSEQRRPRCVCRPEVKQMTFIGKAIFFPQCLSVRRIG